MTFESFIQAGVVRATPLPTPAILAPHTFRIAGLYRRWQQSKAEEERRR